HIFPSGRIVLDAAGASSVTVNQTATFSEYSDGVAHAGGYHAYADLIETASTSSSDYLSPDTPDAIAGARVSDRAFDYTADGFEEGRGSYSVIAFSGSATVDFDGDAQTRYAPVLLLEEFYPKTAPVSALTLYWDATDTTASGSETWTGALTSVLTASMGLRGTAQENDSAGDYASVQTSLNIGDPGTLSLWVRSSSAINPAANEYIFFADTDMNLYFDTSGQLNFRINAGVDLTYAADIYDYSWHQVTCTWDYTTDQYALYVDGKPRARSTTAYAVPTLDGTMVFTAANAAGVSRFSGAIDELRIYNGVEKPTGHVLFHSRMDSAADMTIPQVGNAATVNGTASFTAGVRGSAITFDAAGEYATVPSTGNITASAGTLEMWVKSNVEGNPSVDEQLFFGDAAFNIFFDSDGRINFEISSGVHLTDAADTYDGLWHHVRAMWNYANGQYLLYVDGVQVASSLAVYAMPTIDDVMMYLGAVDAADTNRYNGLIDGFLIYDAMILPYGAYNVPAAWGDAAGKTDSTVLLYWDADSTTLNVGTGSATLGGSITAASAINGSGLVNDSAGEYASFVSTGNIINSEGSLGFWVKSDVTGNPSGVEYLLYAGTDFNVFFDALGFVNFNISSGVNLQHALDIYDARWHFVRCTWNYDDDLYELFVDGVRSASTTNAYTAPALDAVAYVTALNSSGTNRFDGSLDELYVTDSASTPVTATAYGQPVMQPQAAAPYSYRVDVGSNLDGL
ncbi:MAG: laminin G domain-containing protein, partial [Candidatus Omnitrophica bacterium]|nr:laminin G domain-containing protein [Candidatus Omnitrophota bacterium]